MVQAGLTAATGGFGARVQHVQDARLLRQGPGEARPGGVGQGHLAAGPEDQPLHARRGSGLFKALNRVTLSRITHIRGCFNDSVFMQGDE